MSGWRIKSGSRRGPVELLNRARKAAAATGPVVVALQRDLRATVQRNVTAQRYGDGSAWPARKRKVRGRIKMLLRVPANLLYGYASSMAARRVQVLVQDRGKPHYKYQVRDGAPSRNLRERSPFPRGSGREVFKAAFSAWLRDRLNRELKR